ncbi:MAG: DUF11 domain-containing protein [bacterium]
MRSAWRTGTAAALLAIGMGLSSHLLAGANPQNKIAVHVVPHGTTCESLPAFRYCSDIATTYPALGDIDVIPVFFGLNEYLVVEFGLTWPHAWGSMDYTVCAGDLAIGGIVRPGDGIATAWTECQRTWSVGHGYGWLNAASPGLVEIVTNPATGDYGVVDCEPDGHDPMDYPAVTYAAGVGGTPGEDPCGIVFLPLDLAMTDNLGSTCADRWDSVTYTISYGNDTNWEEVTSVVLIDSLPVGAEFVSASSGGTYNPADSKVTWLLGTLAAGETGSQDVMVRITAALGERITNVCLIDATETPATAAGDMIDVCHGNFRRLGLAKTAPGDSVDYGADVTYTIAYDNLTNEDSVHEVVLSDQLPGHTSFVSASPGGVFDGTGQVTWNLGTLAPGAVGSQQVTVSVQVPHGSAFTNRCSLSGDEVPTASAAKQLIVRGGTPRNSYAKIAVHIRAHGSGCKALPAFASCRDIVTTYPGCGDIDAIPVFYDLSEFLVVEFGLTWPAAWGSCSFTRCAGDLAIGYVVNPGDGIAISWTTCQQVWSVVPGIAWLAAGSPGLISPGPDPATGDIGVVNCAPSPGPYYDYPVLYARGGVCGLPGDGPCTGPTEVQPTTWGAIKAMFK